MFAFFLCENFSFFAARITASLRFTANFFLSSEETCPVNYNLVYLYLYIHIVIYYRNKAMLNLYYFASFITVRIHHFFVFSPTTRSTFQLLLELRDIFTGKKRFFHALFSERISQQPRILIVTGVKSSLNTRESFSQVA